jgi:hypothetical protein
VAAEFVGLEPGQAMLARTCGSPPTDFRVARVEVHPGYPEFERIWREYGPHREAGGGEIRALTNSSACDVALLHLESGDGLPAPLPIAERSALESLASGDTVGFAGYPMEAMVLGGVNLRQPTPTVQVGHITAVTDFFGGKDLSGRGQFVQHSLPAAGGASGSPIVGVDGAVVAILSGGNVIGTPEGRVATGVGVNFAQRADLLTELLDGTAEAAQVERTKSWEEGIRQFRSREGAHEVRADAIVEDLVAGWVAGSGKTAVTKDRRANRLSPPDAQGRATARARWEGLPAGAYLAVAVAARGEVDIDLYGEEILPDGGRALFAKDEGIDWYPAIRFTLSAPATVEATIVSGVPETPFRLHLYSAE